eukprot:6420212-Lingulodinium_polyedra.AAC.1
MAEALAGSAVRKGSHAFALCVLLGFHGLLRTGELLALQWQDVACDLVTATAFVNLGFTKSGKRRGQREAVRIDASSL